MSNISTSHLSKVWFKVTDLEVATGRGCRVTTTDGHEYLDFAAGIAVNSTGHSHPAVVAAIGPAEPRRDRWTCPAMFAVPSP